MWLIQRKIKASHTQSQKRNTKNPKKREFVAEGIECTRQGERHRAEINEIGEEGNKASPFSLDCLLLSPPGTQECERGPHPHAGTESWPHSASQAGDSAQSHLGWLQWLCQCGCSVPGPNTCKATLQWAAGLRDGWNSAPSSQFLWDVTPLTRAVSWPGQVGAEFGTVPFPQFSLMVGAVRQLPVLGRGFPAKGLERSQNE